MQWFRFYTPLSAVPDPCSWEIPREKSSPLFPLPKYNDEWHKYLKLVPLITVKSANSIEVRCPTDGDVLEIQPKDQRYGIRYMYVGGEWQAEFPK